jgi:hypothetical protein
LEHRSLEYQAQSREFAYPHWEFQGYRRPGHQEQLAVHPQEEHQV